jgi:hypothetical protein
MDAAAGDNSLFGEAWAIFTDPSHIIAELGWTIITRSFTTKTTSTPSKRLA